MSERYIHQEWPKWFIGPNGQGRGFAAPDKVPDGWRTLGEVSPPILDPDGNPPTGAQPAPETPKRRAARKAREARAAKKAARA